jgi:(1->4)-alpha-D-glucan 1-alpha-D-glucosylmutase
MATDTFAREVERLARLAEDIADLPADVVEIAVADALASLPVYRTYVEPSTGAVTDADRDAVAEAGMPEWLADALLLDAPAPAELVTRFQQTTPPITAKGVEDTAFYRYNRLLALNEVGGDPGRFGLAVDRFHAGNQERLERFPTSMLAATTHDTKRSLDTRSRLAVLASTAASVAGDGPALLDEHARQVRAWFEATEPLVVDGVPGPNERWYLFQTLVGAWPIDPDRLHTHLEKAFREAKVHTSWIEPNTVWEQRVHAFAREVVDLPPFAGDPDGFLERVRREGELASLGQTLLRTTAPGIPDTYQGDDGWFLALVDPDNRRPIDWAPRLEWLGRLRDGDPPSADSVKLHVLHQALQLRRRRPTAFAGAYRPIEAGTHTVAFTRGDDEVTVVAALRPDPDARVALPPGAWHEVLRGREVSVDDEAIAVADLTGPWRLALLERR